ncbi:hypothetical protein EPUS_07551 [Endocarpon pusillum Z07020]|uniref:Uncharacterized protein n=1 Tax=Endocarpon pusillum (strain Z07020 / HMAS-L-300199) TaxID=1263415 RepID=U1HT15_ENDPU|nr:uncharacterized protein EPUS_07551 [Endocarpon pusillum Z07020]ERF72389.1 hypothetical protein EPUS_07551 [Endocarpon pusillum Z07020]
MPSNSAGSSGPDTSRRRSRSRDPSSGASEYPRPPSHPNRIPHIFELPRRRSYDPWLDEAKRNLLRRQADFFNRVDGRRPFNHTKDVDKELKQALINTSVNMTKEEKREIRRWAIHHHITELMKIFRYPRERRKMLDRHLKALLSVQDDDGGDNMWALQGVAQFSLALEKLDLEIINLEQGDSQPDGPARAGAEQEEQEEQQAARQTSLDAASGVEGPDHRVPSWHLGGTRPQQRVPRV